MSDLLEGLDRTSTVEITTRTSSTRSDGLALSHTPPAPRTLRSEELSNNLTKTARSHGCAVAGDASASYSRHHATRPMRDKTQGSAAAPWSAHMRHASAMKDNPAPAWKAVAVL